MCERVRCDPAAKISRGSRRGSSDAIACTRPAAGYGKCSRNYGHRQTFCRVEAWPFFHCAKTTATGTSFRFAGRTHAGKLGTHSGGAYATHAETRKQPYASASQHSSAAPGIEALGNLAPVSSSDMMAVTTTSGAPASTSSVSTSSAYPGNC